MRGRTLAAVRILARAAFAFVGGHGARGGLLLRLLLLGGRRGLTRRLLLLRLLLQ